MRSAGWIALALIASGAPAAHAQPAGPGSADARITIPIEPAPPPRPNTPTDRVPGVDGKDAAGRILEPPAHPDARPWPHGMVIRPGETGDHNVLVPGTMALPWWRPEPNDDRPLGKRFFDGLDRGVGAILDLVVPPST